MLVDTSSCVGLGSQIFTSLVYLCICFVIISISMSWFASLGIGGAATNTSGFGTVSLVLFGATIFVSGNCKAQVEVAVCQVLCRISEAGCSCDAGGIVSL